MQEYSATQKELEYIYVRFILETFHEGNLKESGLYAEIDYTFLKQVFSLLRVGEKKFLEVGIILLYNFFNYCHISIISLIKHQ